MSQIISIDGLRCVNFAPAAEILAKGELDIHNPCSWCSARRPTGPAGKAFFYVQQGRWEFPYVAEANCQNFSLIYRPGQKAPPLEELRRAAEIDQHRNRIAEIGVRFREHWAAFSPREVRYYMGRDLHEGDIIYPRNMTATELFVELTTMHRDLFALRQEVRHLIRVAEKKWGIRDSNLNSWLAATSKQMTELASQIDELESRKHNSPLAVLSRWAFSGVTGSAAWEALKFAIAALGKLL